MHKLHCDLESGTATFACHETVDYSGKASSQEEYHCAGALILMEKEFQGVSGGPGCMVSQMVRIVSRLGMFNPGGLCMDAPIYDSFEEMYDATVSQEESS